MLTQETQAELLDKLRAAGLSRPEEAIYDDFFPVAVDRQCFDDLCLTVRRIGLAKATTILAALAGQNLDRPSKELFEALNPGFVSRGDFREAIATIRAERAAGSTTSVEPSEGEAEPAVEPETDPTAGEESQTP